MFYSAIFDKLISRMSVMSIWKMSSSNSSKADVNLFFLTKFGLKFLVIWFFSFALYLGIFRSMLIASSIESNEMKWNEKDPIRRKKFHWIPWPVFGWHSFYKNTFLKNEKAKAYTSYNITTLYSLSSSY